MPDLDLTAIKARAEAAKPFTIAEQDRAVLVPEIEQLRAEREEIRSIAHRAGSVLTADDSESVVALVQNMADRAERRFATLIAERDGFQAELRQAEFNHESNWCPERNRLTAERDALANRVAELERKMAAADRLALASFQSCHGEDCAFNRDDEDSSNECDECEAQDGRPCSCDCGMCDLWRLALIIRPQGVRDPQPAARED